MSTLKLTPGNKIIYKGNPAIIVKAVDTNLITIQMLNTNTVYTVAPKELEPFIINNDSTIPIDLMSEKEWNTAVFRYKIVTNIIENKLSTLQIKEIAKQNNIHYSTIYRWIKKYNFDCQISALSTKKKTGGKNMSRLSAEVDEVINDLIANIYLSSSKKSIKKLTREINMKCKELDLKAPHENTIRNRLKNLSEESVLKARYGSKARRDKFEPIRGNFPGADYPLSIVQLDHTCVDIILVDELYRKPFRRPYLTIAIDVFSRMVVGFYLSFDPPGAMGTGLCVANTILGKEALLEKYDLDGEWPCWGTMKVLHLDNAKEFRGNMLKRACQNYGIIIEHRPVKTPHWGGHVERLLGTFSKEIHNLAGSTFSNISERENYNSFEKASLTISEFEKWLIIYIVNVYHKKIHSGIMMSPLEKYKRGIFGTDNEVSTGLPPKLFDERRVRLDFMPYEERTIQEYGVLIDHITYYADVLRKYIHTKEDNGKYSKKQKFLFKRDPRDISIIYFYDPNLNDYYEVPYRDTSRPPMSIWEFNETISKLRRNNIPINEDSIFNAYKEMNEIEYKAIQNTKKLKRFSRFSDKRNENVHNTTINRNERSTENEILNIKTITPFDEIDDEAFTS